MHFLLYTHQMESMAPFLHTMSEWGGLLSTSQTEQLAVAG